LETPCVVTYASSRTIKLSYVAYLLIFQHINR